MLLGQLPAGVEDFADQLFDGFRRTHALDAHFQERDESVYERVLRVQGDESEELLGFQIIVLSEVSASLFFRAVVEVAVRLTFRLSNHDPGHWDVSC